MAIAMDLDEDVAAPANGKDSLSSPEGGTKRKKQLQRVVCTNEEKIKAHVDVVCTSSDWNLRIVNGFDLNSNETSVTSDGKYVIVNSSDRVLVFAVCSGKLIRTLNTGSVIAVKSGSKEGTLFTADANKICLWDFFATKIVKEFLLKGKVKLDSAAEILDVLIPNNFEEAGNVFVTVKLHMKNSLFRVNVNTGAANRIFKSIAIGSAHIGEHCNSVCAISNPPKCEASNATLVVYDQNLSKIFRVNTDQDRPFTIARVHPQERIIACGDGSGRIIIYTALEQAEPVKSILHWHSLPVTGLFWSEEGATLYSGGGESVLCKWRREDGSKPQFVPRIGAPIVGVGGGAGLVVLQLKNNSLVLLDQQEDKVHSIVGGLGKSETGWPAGIIVNRDLLLLNGCVGKLQVYNTVTNNVHNLDITGQNYLTEERSVIPQNSEVERMAVSQCGRYLATVDCQWSTVPRITLKFWTYEPTIENFTLNTQVDSPHASSVLEVLFQPKTHTTTSPNLLSVGKDCIVKLWNHEGSSWTCSSSLQMRGLRASSGAWSNDGTLLGVAFSHLITLWDTNSQLKSTLADTNSNEPITSLDFGKEHSARLLFSATASILTAWDLLLLVPIWKLDHAISPYTRLLTCPSAAIIAIVQKDVIQLHSTATGESIHKLENTNCTGGAAWCDDPKASSGSALYFLTYSGALQRLGSKHVTANTTPINNTQNGLERLLSINTKGSQKNGSVSIKKWTKSRQQNDLEELFSFPIHTLLSPSQLKTSMAKNRLVALPRLKHVKARSELLESRIDDKSQKKIDKYNQAFKLADDPLQEMPFKTFYKLLKVTHITDE